MDFVKMFSGGLNKIWRLSCSRCGSHEEKLNPSIKTGVGIGHRDVSVCRGNKHGQLRQV
jgi:hypothetical protein